jgi:hypothetical protein
MQQPRLSQSLNPTRRALLGAGVATLALSLALSIAPAWAQSNNGAPNGNGADAGTVKIRDASTGDLLSDASNDPHVCAFSVLFEYSSPTSGTWDILSWAPTGDGSQVSSGTWDTRVGGTDETDVMTLAAGHYRLEYQADGASNSRNKTFWVEDGCEGSGGTSGGDQPSDSPSDSPAESPTDPPSDSPSDQPSDQQGDTGGSEQPGDPGDPGDQGQDQQGDTGSNDQGQDQQGDTGSNDQGQDQQGDTGGSEQPGDPGDQGQEGGVQGATGGENGSGGSQPSDGGSQSSGSAPSAQPTDHDGGTQGVTSPAAGAGGTKLPDTATTPASVLSPLLAALGLLLVIAAHPFIRRSALADRA